VAKVVESGLQIWFESHLPLTSPIDGTCQQCMEKD